MDEENPPPALKEGRRGPPGNRLIKQQSWPEFACRAASKRVRPGPSFHKENASISLVFLSPGGFKKKDTLTLPTSNRSGSSERGMRWPVEINFTFFV